MSHPKNQHYVPQFILRYFCFDNEHLYCFDKQNGNIFIPNVRNIASEKYFYDIENGRPEFSLEYCLAEIEEKAGFGIKKLNYEHTLKCLIEEDYKNISMLIAIQMLRTKSSREELWHINREVSKILRNEGFDPDSVGNFHEFKSEKEVKEVALYNLKIATNLYPSIIDKKWILYTSGDKFIISDNPVVKQNTMNKDPYRGTLGLANNGIEIYFPLSPSIVLCLFCNNTFNNIANIYDSRYRELDKNGNFETRNFVNSVRRKIPIECNPENIENINSLQIIYSERFIFSKCSEFSIVNEMINTDSSVKKGRRSIIN